MGTTLSPNLASFAVTQSCKDPKAVSVPLNFSLASQFKLDLKPLIDTGAFDAVLAVYVDNLNNNARFDILSEGILQTVSVPANSQGYLPILTANPPSFQFSTSANGTVNVFLLNYDVPPAVWKP